MQLFWKEWERKELTKVNFRKQYVDWTLQSSKHVPYLTEIPREYNKARKSENIKTIKEE